ncbi:cadherin repeat domain-containing protein [Mesorhizobium sp. A623]
MIASDPENDPLTYSIASGGDAILFDIDTFSGELSFMTAPDFENPESTGANASNLAHPV